MKKQILSVAIALTTVLLSALPSLADTATTAQVISQSRPTPHHERVILHQNTSSILQAPEEYSERKGGPGPHGKPPVVEITPNKLQIPGEYLERRKGGPGPHGVPQAPQN